MGTEDYGSIGRETLTEVKGRNVSKGMQGQWCQCCRDPGEEYALDFSSSLVSLGRRLSSGKGQAAVGPRNEWDVGEF